MLLSPTILIIYFRNIHGKVYLSNKKVGIEIPTLSSLMQLNSLPRSAAEIVTAFTSIRSRDQ